jgi:hypothetical protein
MLESAAMVVAKEDEEKERVTSVRASEILPS